MDFSGSPRAWHPWELFATPAACSREAEPFSPTPARSSSSVRFTSRIRFFFFLFFFSSSARRFRSRDFGDDHRTCPCTLVKSSLFIFLFLSDCAEGEERCRFPAFLPVPSSVALLGPVASISPSSDAEEASFARNADVFPRRKLFLLSARL